MKFMSFYIDTSFKASPTKTGFKKVSLDLFNDEKFLLLACAMAAHKKCHDKILFQCTQSAADSQGTMVRYYLP